MKSNNVYDVIKFLFKCIFSFINFTAKLCDDIINFAHVLRLDNFSKHKQGLFSGI